MNSDITSGDDNFYVDQPWNNCSNCSTAHGRLRLTKDIPAFHCFICNKCCLSDFVLNNSEESRRTVLGLNHGLTNCGIANKMANVRLLGSFILVCTSCKSAPRAKVSTIDKNTMNDNCPPLWFSKFSEEISVKMNCLDDKVSSNISALAADLAAMKGNVSEQIDRFEHLQAPAVTDWKSPPRKRTKSFPDGKISEDFPPITALPNVNSAVLKLPNRAGEDTATVFKEMCNIKRKSGVEMPDFVKSKRSTDGSVDILLKSYKDAL